MVWLARRPRAQFNAQRAFPSCSQIIRNTLLLNLGWPLAGHRHENISSSHHLHTFIARMKISKGFSLLFPLSVWIRAKLNYPFKFMEECFCKKWEDFGPFGWWTLEKIKKCAKRDKGSSPEYFNLGVEPTEILIQSFYVNFTSYFYSHLAQYQHSPKSTLNPSLPNQNSPVCTRFSLLAVADFQRGENGFGLICVASSHP